MNVSTLSHLRASMPVTRSWAYLDHAAVAPLPTQAAEALREYTDDMATNGVVACGRWLDRSEALRRRFGQMLNVGPTDLALVKNTSEGIAFVAEGVRWRAGDNVVTAADEYPSNLYPWMNLADRGVELRKVPPRADGRLHLDDLAAAMDERTRLVTISFVQYATGQRIDLAAVGELCRRRGAYFFVDAIQGLGVFPLDARALGVDFLAADGHKWLLGPEGAGVLYVARDRVEELRCVSVGWHSVVDLWAFSHTNFQLQPHAGRWEAGTLNMAGLAALEASVGLLHGVGREALAGSILELTDRLCDLTPRAGWAVFSGRSGDERSGIVSLVPPGGRPAASAVRWLRERGVVVNQRAGRLRVSPHAYNTAEEIDRLAQLLGEVP